MNRLALAALIVLTTVGVAALDLWTSADLIASILFTLPLALCAAHGSRPLLWGTASAAAVLTVLAGLWGIDRAPHLESFAAWINRAVLVASSFTLTTFIHLWMKKTRRLVLDHAEIERQARSLVAQNVELEALVAAALRSSEVRKEADKHLAQLESRYRGLLETASDAKVVTGNDGRILLVNAQTEALFGYPRSELIGQLIEILVPEPSRAGHPHQRAEYVAGTRNRPMGSGIELSGRRKDGSVFPAEIGLSSFVTDDGTLVSAVIRDIGARKAAVKHLAQMEQRYRGLLEAAPDAMVLMSQDGAIALVNIQAEKQFGYRREELVGQQLQAIVPEVLTKIPDVERQIVAARQSAANSMPQEIGAGIELDGRRKDGRLFPIEVTLGILHSVEGIVVTVALRDITMRKRTEAQLLRTVAELNRSNEELSQFAYIASHDLQEPLRMVASYTQLLAKRYQGKLDADADEFIAFAVDGANRMQRLIQDLLAYSRIGTHRADLVDTSSENALAQAITNLRATISDRGAVVTHDPLPAVLGDAPQLVQLFQNLVGNAIKYQGAGVPRIHVAAKRTGKEWTISVQDNGLGIESRYFEKIFGMFQRLHKREEFAGTGIGLAICKKIVERHGGKIWVASQPGKGSTFSFGLNGSEKISCT